MFITKKHIPRRTFLRGAGVTLALPLLESMVPALTPLRLTAAAPVRRFVGIWHPHGAAPGYWSPLQEGKDFEFSFITKPLEPFRNRVVLITGLDMPEAMATDDEPGGDHARGAVLLSGARPRRNAVSPFLGVTIDQHDRATSTARTRSCRRCSSASRTPATSATATGATAAPTRTRSRGRRRRSRCRRRSIRAWCSSACSATAPAPRSGCADRQQNASILDAVVARARRVQDAVSAPATRRASTPTSRTSASSSGASRSRWTTR